MTQPITVYPTTTPGVWCTPAGQAVTRFYVPVLEMRWCVNCLQLLETPSDEHWRVSTDFYCKNCVVVADEENQGRKP